jgi:hypothetical protein
MDLGVTLLLKTLAAQAPTLVLGACLGTEERHR